MLLRNEKQLASNRKNSSFAVWILCGMLVDCAKVKLGRQVEAKSPVPLRWALGAGGAIGATGYRIFGVRGRFSFC